MTNFAKNSTVKKLFAKKITFDTFFLKIAPFSCNTHFLRQNDWAKKESNGFVFVFSSVFNRSRSLLAIIIQLQNWVIVMIQGYISFN